MEPIVITGPTAITRELIRQRALAIRERFGEAIRQIFRVSEWGTPEPFGSAVLFTLGDTHLLISAAHVLELSQHETLYIGGSNELVPIVGKLVRMDVLDPELDIAFVELSNDDTTAHLGDVTFITPLDTDPNDTMEDKLYYSLGFPWRKSKKDLEAKIIRSELISITTSSQQELYERAGVPAHSHLVVGFNRKGMLVGGSSAMPPKPEGISGGGMWRPENWLSPAISARPARLVGILTRYNEGNGKYLVAVRISVVFEGLRRIFPDRAHLLVRSQAFQVTRTELDGRLI